MNITIDRAIVEQTLEALEWHYRQGHSNTLGGLRLKIDEKALRNLRAALAEPVQEKRAVFILTREINEYDQDGEYFVEVFDKKPSLSLLAENGVPPDRLEHVLKGGGRVGNEYEWFHLSAHNVKE